MILLFIIYVRFINTCYSNEVKMVVYGQGVETFCANMSSLMPSSQVKKRFPININLTKL